MRVAPSSRASTSYSTSSGPTSTRQKSQGNPDPLPPHMRMGMALRRAATLNRAGLVSPADDTRCSAAHPRHVSAADTTGGSPAEPTRDSPAAHTRGSPAEPAHGSPADVFSSTGVDPFIRIRLVPLVRKRYV